jgi:hypothetical protein
MDLPDGRALALLRSGRHCFLATANRRLVAWRCLRRRPQHSDRRQRPQANQRQPDEQALPFDKPRLRRISRRAKRRVGIPAETERVPETDEVSSDRPACHAKGDGNHDPLRLAQPVSQEHPTTMPVPPDRPGRVPGDQVVSQASAVACRGCRPTRGGGRRGPPRSCSRRRPAPPCQARHQVPRC